MNIKILGINHLSCKYFFDNQRRKISSFSTVLEHNDPKNNSYLLWFSSLQTNWIVIVLVEKNIIEQNLGEIFPIWSDVRSFHPFEINVEMFTSGIVSNFCDVSQLDSSHWLDFSQTNICEGCLNSRDSTRSFSCPMIFYNFIHLIDLFSNQKNVWRKIMIRTIQYLHRFVIGREMKEDVSLKIIDNWTIFWFDGFIFCWIRSIWKEFSIEKTAKENIWIGDFDWFN